MEIIGLTVIILTQANKLSENEAAGGALKAVTGWIGDILGKPSAKEKLQQIEQNQNIEANVNSIKASLEFVLEGNEQLQNELAAKIAELQRMMKKEGISMPTAANTTNTSDNRIIINQGIPPQNSITITR
jgi:tRNA uridine 5-carbamoylmethylation protein Kti12